MSDGKIKKSPCITCQRVMDPQDCENKNCQVWREWFLFKWNEIRKCSGIDIAKKAEEKDRVKHCEVKKDGKK